MDNTTLFGRRKILSGVEKVTRDNVIDVIKSALPTHKINSYEITYLIDYYRGKQPILEREKLIRPTINNKLVENNAFDIVSFRTGYVYGDPIQYVRRGDITIEDKTGVNSKDTSLNIGHLNEWLFSEGKHAVDKKIGEYQNICGTAYRGVLPDADANVEEDEAPFEISALDPRNTFVVYSTRFGEKPLLGVMIIKQENRIVYACYTPTEYFEISKDLTENEVIPYSQNELLYIDTDYVIDETKSRPHALGGIPIIEYPLNNYRLGAFEPILSLLDALNNLASNRIDGVEQFVQYLLKFINCEIDEKELGDLISQGAVAVNSREGFNADVEIMTAELNQDQVQTMVDYIYKKALKIAGMPYSESASGGDTGQAVILRDGWTEAESRAKDTEIMFKESEKLFLKVLLTILRDKADFDLMLRDIDIKFTRNRTDNLLVKTQGLQNLLEAGVAPQIAINAISLFSDPEQVVLDSEEYLEKWKTAGKPMPNQQSDATNDKKVENNTGNYTSDNKVKVRPTPSV